MDCHLDIRPNSNPLSKKFHSSMRVWVQFPKFSNIRVCEFILEFLKKKKNTLDGLKKYYCEKLTRLAKLKWSKITRLKTRLDNLGQKKWN